MGAALGKNKKQSKVICVGLDNSGKSTIINYLKPDKLKATEMNATVGYSFEQFQWGSVQFSVFDMSGQSRYRSLWEQYYAAAQGIIFVIDSSDLVRMCVVADELDILLSHKDFQRKNIPILFFSNKMDLAKALNPAQIAEQLSLSKLEHPHTIIASNALNGTGLEEGVKWLAAHLP